MTGELPAPDPTWVTLVQSVGPAAAIAVAALYFGLRVMREAVLPLVAAVERQGEAQRDTQRELATALQGLERSVQVLVVTVERLDARAQHRVRESER